MAYFNEGLQQLKDKVTQKKRMEAELLDLYAQKKNLTTKTAELEKIKNSEQRDVERLEGGSLAAFFYNVVGKMDEKLTKEKEEAYKAAVKYEASKEELLSVEREIFQREETVKALEGCETAYERAFEERLKAVRMANTSETETVLRIEGQMYELECQKREIREALSAGRQAISTVEAILDDLDDAEGWAAWDTFGGGGLFSDLMKHDHLDDAQTKINRLQIELRKFKTELSDVEVHADIQVQIEEFLKFADYFFDGLFADWAVMDKIEQSTKRVKHTRNEVTAVISKLEDKLKNVECHYQKKLEEREKEVLNLK